MSLPSVVAISGSLNAPSRTRSLVNHIVAAVARSRAVTTQTYDLVEIGPKIALLTGRAGIGSEAAAIYDGIESADLLIVGSPIYKASYSGLLKHLLDLVHPDALRGVPVILSATGGSDRHALALEHQFRPLFGFFNAVTLGTTVYAVEADIEKTGNIRNPDLAARIDLAAAEALALLASRMPERAAA
jgi:FMN reductase